MLSANKLSKQLGPQSFVFGIAKYIGSVVQRETQRLLIGSATRRPTQKLDGTQNLVTLVVTERFAANVLLGQRMTQVLDAQSA